MSGYCRDCPEARWDGGENKYFCDYKYEYVDEYDTCYKHPDNYPSDDVDDSIDDTTSEVSFCYITTASCSILGMKDDNVYLNTLRDFRNNVMKKDKKYHKMLVLYDIVGPKISKSLLNDNDKLELANGIMNKIKSAVDSIKNNDYDEAVNKYYNMTRGLADYYGIEVPEISDDIVNSIVIEMAGTGKVYKKSY